MTTVRDRPARPAGHRPPAAVPASTPALDPALAPRWALELALAVLTVAGLLGFHRVFSGATWVGPVLGTALATQVVCRLTRRHVAHPVAAGLVDLVAVALLTAWTVVPSSTAFGVPLDATWRAVHAALTGLGPRMEASSIPARPVTGFLLLATLGAGIVALAGSWIAFRLERVLPALAPSVTAFVACCCLGTRSGRAWSVIVEVGAAGGFLLVAAAGARAHSARFAARGRSPRGLFAGGIAVVVAAVVAGLAALPFLPSSDGHGLLGWRDSGSSTTRSVFSPLVALPTRLLQESQTPAFVVDSPVRSYWRLTSLDSFNGTFWSARDSYEGVDDKLPGVGPVPKGAREVRERFQIQTLDSAWLPLAFDPRSVTGAGSVSYDAGSGSLLTRHATANGLDYTVTSLQYLDTLSPAALRRAAPVTAGGALAPDLALPASVPAEVRDLARAIVAGRRTEYAKALALQDYFYGPQFHYSLHPPTDGSGDAALEQFLFVTHTGYCQQFAGSYAVLARAAGLPTRLAVGFTSGTEVAPGRYQVTDADAHVWPEVWFPGFGWIPFEPTKGSPGAGFAIPGTTGYTGNTAAVSPVARAATGPTPTPTTAPTTPTHLVTPSGGRATTSSPPSGAHVRSLPGGSGGGAAHVPKASQPAPTRRSRPDHVGDALGIAAGALLALIALGVLGRKVRWGLRRRGARRRTPDGRYGPSAAALRWDETAERLAWNGARRQAWETPHQFAQRVSEDRRAACEISLGTNLDRLADLLTTAQYGADGVSGAELVAADECVAQVAALLRRGRRWPERLRILVDPRLAWAPVVVEPAGGVRAVVR